MCVHWGVLSRCDVRWSKVSALPDTTVDSKDAARILATWAGVGESKVMAMAMPCPPVHALQRCQNVFDVCTHPSVLRWRVVQCPDDGGIGVNIRKAFRQYDVDGNGSIDRSEFEGLLRDLGSKPSPWKIDEAFATVDSDGSGKISYDEFAKYDGPGK